MSLTDDPRGLVDSHEARIGPSRRRALGAHYTPAELACRIVALGMERLGRVPRLVLDPSCGAGSVLLAVADALVAAGVDPSEVPGRLVGHDLDAEALVVARGALDAWSEHHGAARGEPPALLRADALTSGPHPPGVDLVVGNPPFASPLHGGVAGGQFGPYTDTSARHLLAAVRGAAAGTVVCMLQPQSLLGARDAAGVRTALAEHAALAALWATDEQPFDAAVQVCAPVLEVGGRRGSGQMPVEVRWREGPPVASTVDPTGSWSPLLAAALGVPAPPDGRSGPDRTVADVATCTAGFRDEFYALAEVAREWPGEGPAPRPLAGAARLVTSGMIDPARIDWGGRARRLAGRSMSRPAIHLEELGEVSPRVAGWVHKRLVPKVLVASQTSIVEAAVDRYGDHVPVTPVVSVEPDDPVAGITPEVLAAVLGAPTNSAHVAAAGAGTGRSTGSLRISASALSTLVVPTDDAALAELAAAWRRLERAVLSPAPDPEPIGAALDRALGFDDPEVLRWWAERASRRITAAQAAVGT